MKYAAFLRKRTNTNPKFGPIHYRSPAKILWRTIRGMLPHKTAKGQAALGRLKVFEGIPAPYDKVGPQPGPRGLLAGEGGGGGVRYRRLFVCRSSTAELIRCPVPTLSQMKRMVVPEALRVTRLKPGRRYCLLGRMSAECGWSYRELVERLEDKRKAEALEFYAKKKELMKARAEVAASVPKPAVLTESGY